MPPIAVPAPAHIRLPRLTDRARRALSAPALVALLVAASFVLRAGTFGDPNLHDDELFYFYVGQRMHDGVLPYVGIWDRKPPGLFLLYALIAGISRSVLAYQVAAALSAGLTASLVARIARRLGASQGQATLPALLYLVALPLLGGWGGQVAVFMNLLTALAADLSLGARDQLRAGLLPGRAIAAMASIGLALTLKQTAACEGLFLAAWILRQFAASSPGRGTLFRAACLLGLIAAAPFLAWTAYYAAIGHLSAFWHAMVLANLHKAYNPSHDLPARWLALAVRLGPLIALALAGLAGRPFLLRDPAARFCTGWLAAALAGAALVPNLLDHYALPVLVPLAVLATPCLRMTRHAPLIVLAIAGGFMAKTHGFEFDRATRSAAMMDGLLAEIRARDPHPALLVYDGPVYLHALLDTPPASPLALPFHLNYTPERNTSPFDTAAEFRRILATRPSLVVTGHRTGPNNLLNPETGAMVARYIARECRWQFSHRLLNAEGDATIVVHGGCRHPLG